jgi:ribosomal-protein-alanine N-acetyltransferase
MKADSAKPSRARRTMPVLLTPRLRLRPLAAGRDAAFIRELVNEPGWLRHIGDRGIRTLAAARTYVRQGPRAMYAEFGFGLLAIERRRDGKAVGICGLIKRPTLNDIDLGYALLARHEGRGYAAEAAATVLADGERRLGLRRVVAITSPDNTRSIRLLEKLGFRFERRLRLKPDGPESRLFVRRSPARRAAAKLNAEPDHAVER